MSFDTIKSVLAVAARVGVEALAANRNLTEEQKRKLMKAIEDAATGAAESVARIAAIYHRKE